ncbi:RidA family protein [Alteromonadaceae bacterium BrNp21-10]|nr:RidA family protein [Alteromonadaceae bacterium BrNp21-10]
MKKQLCMAALALFVTTQVSADAVKRYPLPGGSSFPIASAVEVKAGSTIFESGNIPSPKDAKAEAGTLAFWGNTEEQTDSVLAKIEASLKGKGLDMGSVVKMTVFLVGDPAMDGKMDFSGFMKSYVRYFGTEAQPNLPARSAVQVAGLVAPGMMVEIEVIAVRPE